MSVIVKPMKETFNGRIATLRWYYYIFFAMKSQVKNIISAGGFPPALEVYAQPMMFRVGMVRFRVLGFMRSAVAWGSCWAG
jgi:hypothetical protein